ncbi:glycosyltransferase family 4 protein [Maribacter arenosus]|uniref:Glycosyltransferase family 4 protein n=1 Tax=Maribacter arenosus TaxID=1854708 RepID=A0ABR7VE39_9FLAO|nr:glycosyltransferase family 4 protein [Maribacter arenosus]MBD0850588.1 glycosyltransferase family 4 protein [Maribacter arenosus]
MKLYLVSNMYPSAKNVRYGIFVKRFREAIEKDYDITEIVLTKKKSLIAKGLGYFILYLKVIKLWFIVKEKDIVYVHFPLYFSPVLLPLTWKKTTLVLNFHGSDAIFETPLKRVLATALKPILSRSNIVVPSAFFQKEIQDVFNSTIKSIFVYPSGGVNGKIFYPKKTASKTFVFGFVSNFIETKGWSVFLNALIMLKASDKITRFEAIMVGDGTDLEKIREQIKSKELPVMLIKSVKQDQLVDIYRRFNVFVFPTYRESLGLVGIEAMMCGIPVIASRVQGPMDYMEQGYNGYLFNMGDSKDLAEKMMKFYRLSEEEKEKMSLHCLETSKKYDNIKVKKELLTWLKTINL